MKTKFTPEMQKLLDDVREELDAKIKQNERDNKAFFEKLNRKYK